MPPARNWMFWTAVWLTLWFNDFVSDADAQMTLDGTNCVVFDTPVSGELARCVAFWPGERTLKISLIGRVPNSVTKVALSFDGSAPFQMLELRTQPILDKQNIGLLITDMNFDGYRDFAIMERAAADPNTPFIYFLFDTDNNLYARSASLEAVVSPTFDETKKQVRSTWRDGAARSGADTFIWLEGTLVLDKRRERIFSDTGCLENHYRNLGGKLELDKTVECSP